MPACCDRSFRTSSRPALTKSIEIISAGAAGAEAVGGADAATRTVPLASSCPRPSTVGLNTTIPRTAHPIAIRTAASSRPRRWLVTGARRRGRKPKHRPLSLIFNGDAFGVNRDDLGSIKGFSNGEYVIVQDR